MADPFNYIDDSLSYLDELLSHIYDSLNYIGDSRGFSVPSPSSSFCFPIILVQLFRFCIAVWISDVTLKAGHARLNEYSHLRMITPLGYDLPSVGELHAIG